MSLRTTVELSDGRRLTAVQLLSGATVESALPPLPSWALEPVTLRSPPIANDGSAPQCCSATVSIEVVVVLPCVPATARP